MSITAQTVTPAIPTEQSHSPRLARRWFAVLLGCSLALSAARAQQPESRPAFRVKYIADGAVYLEGGSGGGLAVGQKLVVKRSGTTAPRSGSGEVQASRIIAQLEVVSVAETSAVCEVRSLNAPLRVGDMATPVIEEGQPQAQLSGMGASRKYPQLIAFSAGDPLDEEAREAVPRPQLPEVNRRHGRVGVEYSALAGRNGSSMANRQVGLVARMEMTRIGGSYWNFTGYWRGRVDFAFPPPRGGTPEPLPYSTHPF